MNHSEELKRETAGQTPGKLLVIEGPDGVGKTTISAAVCRAIDASGTQIELLTFPGREIGTLGHLVYQVHHDPQRFGIADMSADAKQALHIAAHLDAIERRILPALRAGRNVVLDRFWWSTWVYGSVSGIGKQLLDALIRVERTKWAGTQPTIVILLDRESPIGREYDPASWQALRAEYELLARREQGAYPVAMIKNAGSLDATIVELLALLRDIGIPPAAGLEDPSPMSNPTKGVDA